MEKWPLKQKKNAFYMHKLSQLAAIPEAKNWFYDGVRVY